MIQTRAGSAHSGRSQHGIVRLRPLSFPDAPSAYRSANTSASPYDTRSGEGPSQAGGGYGLTVADDQDNVRPLTRGPRSAAPVPVRHAALDAGALQVVSFVGGSEQAAVLHAAAGWIAERPNAVIIALNWLGDQGDEENEPPPYRLDLVADMTYYHPLR